MYLFHITLLALALFLLSVSGQGASTAATAGVDLSKIPLCFSTCAGDVAASPQIGCGSLLNFTCICSNPQFPIGVSQCINTTTTNDCPTLSKNRTALQDNQEIFASICKSAAGTKPPSTAGPAVPTATAATPTLGATAGTPIATGSAGTPTGSGSAARPTTSVLSGTNAAPTLVPSVQHVIIATLVLLPIFVCGAYAVL